MGLPPPPPRVQQQQQQQQPPALLCSSADWLADYTLCRERSPLCCSHWWPLAAGFPYWREGGIHHLLDTERYRSCACASANAYGDSLTDFRNIHSNLCTADRYSAWDVNPKIKKGRISHSAFITSTGFHHEIFTSIQSASFVTFIMSLKCHLFFIM